MRHYKFLICVCLALYCHSHWRIKLTMRKKEMWILLSRVILVVLLLEMDTCVHAESSYDGDIKGIIHLKTIALIGKLFCLSILTIATKT